MLQEILDNLWGGVVKEYRLGLAEHVLVMSIEVLDTGTLSHYVVQLSGISFLQFLNETEESWDYVELTSISARLTADGKYEVEMEFWLSTSTMEIRCKKLEVNGQSL